MLTPQELRLLLNLLNLLDASTNLSKTLAAQGTQSQQDTAVQTWTSICQNVASAFAVGGVGLATDGVGLLDAYGIALAASIGSERACKLLAPSFINLFNAQSAVLQNDLDAAQSAYSNTSAQAAQFNALINAASAGNFAAAVVAANQLAAASNFVSTTNSDGSITYQQSGFTTTVASNWQPISLIAKNADGTSEVTVFNSTGFVTNYYSGSNGSGTVTSSDIGTNNSDGSVTIVSHAGPNGTGSITKTDQENPNGTSVITTYGPNGTTTTTTYSNPNGTGTITQMVIKGAASTITRQFTSITYNYTGNEIYSTGSSPQAQGVVSGTTTFGVDASGNIEGTPSTFSLSNSGKTVTQATPAGVGVPIAFEFNSADQITNWRLEVVTQQPGSFAIFTIGHDPLQPSTDYSADSGPLGGLNQNNPGTWTLASYATNVTVSPIAGQTQQLSAVLSNASLVQGMQTLMINGPGTVAVTGSYSLPNIIDNGTLAIASGLSLQVTSRLVENAGSTITGVVTGAGASTIIELAAGKSGSISSGLSNIGTIAIDAGASWTVTGSYSLPNIVDNGAIVLASGANLQVTSRLVEGAGSSITGVVTGAGASTTIELASGKSGSISTGLSNIGTIAIDAGASWTVTGSYSLPNIVDNGTIAIASSSSLDIFLALDSASTGVFQLQNTSTLELAAALGHNTQIQFLGTTNDKLVIDKASSFGTGVGTASYAGPLLESFAAGDLIDLKGIASAGLGPNYSSASGDLQITNSAGAAMATLLFQNSSLGGGTFHVASDGAGGTLLTHS